MFDTMKPALVKPLSSGRSRSCSPSASWSAV